MKVDHTDNLAGNGAETGTASALYASASPREVRALIRAGEITSPTAGMAAGYAQANLVILPAEYASDFAEYARINPAPCPVLETLKASPYTRLMAADGNIHSQIPHIS